MKFDFSQLLGQNTAIILENPINIRYLTNCPIDDGFMIICEQGKFLLVDDRYLLDAKTQDDTQVVRLTSFNKQLPKLIEKFHVKRVLLEEKYVTLSRYNNYLNILPKINVDLTSSVSNYLLNMRAKKMPDEIKKIKEAQRLADEAFAYIVDYVKPGVTEKEIAVKLEQKLLELGSEGRAFDFIVVSGERTAIPHGKPTEREIKDGDFVTIDFGAKVDGYSSDMTRTLAIGKIDDEKREEVSTAGIEVENVRLEDIKAFCNRNHIPYWGKFESKKITESYTYDYIVCINMKLDKNTFSKIKTIYYENINENDDKQIWSMCQEIKMKTQSN